MKLPHPSSWKLPGPERLAVGPISPLAPPNVRAGTPLIVLNPKLSKIHPFTRLLTVKLAILPFVSIVIWAQGAAALHGGAVPLEPIKSNVWLSAMAVPVRVAKHTNRKLTIQILTAIESS